VNTGRGELESNRPQGQRATATGVQPQLGAPYATQGGLELLDSNNPPPSAFESLGLQVDVFPQAFCHLKAHSSPCLCILFLRHCY
jgi:hypothetical protein